MINKLYRLKVLNFADQLLILDCVSLACCKLCIRAFDYTFVRCSLLLLCFPDYIQESLGVVCCTKVQTENPVEDCGTSLIENTKYGNRKSQYFPSLSIFFQFNNRHSSLVTFEIKGVPCSGSGPAVAIETLSNGTLLIGKGNNRLQKCD